MIKTLKKCISKKDRWWSAWYVAAVFAFFVLDDKLAGWALLIMAELMSDRHGNTTIIVESEATSESKPHT